MKQFKPLILILLMTSMSLPALANGIKYRDGFIQDAADERNISTHILKHPISSNRHDIEHILDMARPIDGDLPVIEISQIERPGYVSIPKKQEIYVGR